MITKDNMVCLKLIAWSRRQRSAYTRTRRGKAKIEAMSGFESYRSTVRNRLKEEKLKGKFEGGGKEKMETSRARCIGSG